MQNKRKSIPGCSYNDTSGNSGKSAVCICGRSRGDGAAALYATFWALIPPVVAIALALITKEVYSSLFLGILVGGLLYSGFSFEGTVTHIFQGGIHQCSV